MQLYLFVLGRGRQFGMPNPGYLIQTGDGTNVLVDTGPPRDLTELGALADFFELLGRPGQQAQFARLEALGLNTDSDLERSLGRRVVDSLPDA